MAFPLRSALSLCLIVRVVFALVVPQISQAGGCCWMLGSWRPILVSVTWWNRLIDDLPLTPHLLFQTRKDSWSFYRSMTDCSTIQLPQRHGRVRLVPLALTPARGWPKHSNKASKARLDPWIVGRFCRLPARCMHRRPKAWVGTTTQPTKRNLQLPCVGLIGLDPDAKSHLCLGCCKKSDWYRECSMVALGGMRHHG